MTFIIELFTKDFLQGLISSLIITFSGWVCTQIYISLAHKSSYSGKWEFRIFDDNMRPTYIDSIKLCHNSRTGLIKGKIQSIYPQERTVWKPRKIMGVLMRDRLLTISYTKEPIDSMSTTHSILIIDYHFTGYILHYNMDTSEIEKKAIVFKKV